MSRDGTEYILPPTRTVLQHDTRTSSNTVRRRDDIRAALASAGCELGAGDTVRRRVASPSRRRR